MGRYLNPVLPGCHPDPSICRVGDTFYLVTSSFEYLPGLPVHASKTLVDWTQIGHVIDRPGQLDLSGLASSRGLFAPTIRHDGELFHVVCTVVGPDDGGWPGRTGHFVVTAVEAAGPWSDVVWIDGVGGIDPSLTFDGERVWLTTTGLSPEARWPGQTDVSLVELDRATFQPLSPPTVIWRGALRGSVWAEGPHIRQRPGGGWMLAAAEGGTDTDHAVCVAYADDITGPYVGDPGNPRLTHRHLGSRAELAAVGHADLVDDEAGRTWATVLATRTVDGVEGLLGRQTHLVPVDWEERRPLFAPGSGRVELVVEDAGVAEQQPRRRDFSDDFAGPGLDGAWNGVGRHPGTFAELDEQGGLVRLRPGAEPATVRPQSFLGRRLPASDVSVSIDVELVPAADASHTAGHSGAHTAEDAGVHTGARTGLRGGLLLRTSERAHVEISLDDAGIIRCVSTTGGVSRQLATSADDPGRGLRHEPRRRVTIGLEVNGLSGVATIDGAPFVDVDLSGLVPEAGSGFVGAWIGPIALGDGGGHVAVHAVSTTVTAS
ncbi:glycoside hydrolase family 43 protein [Agreia sp. COWG]|uniref:glycoside hydrolase family 43 protein n=1 Tax=Agreia sp. COWG TaxID=2773266 RepID=UPI001927F82E|nr:glycoside hydrolase family 43 protein [Agreia sp. COWG]CAD5991049.1 Beta-xylosidase [Agreia sp. COWG]